MSVFLSLFKNPLYYLLIAVPLTLLGEFVFHWDPLWIFVLACAGIIPLAKLVGEATEELAVHTGPKIGGLLNATLGNAAELIITIFALREGLVDLVRASIAGSIIGNLLLVMGLSLLFGGFKNGTQVFDKRTAGVNATLLLLALFALLIPSMFDSAIAGDLGRELPLSEGVSVIMIVLYAMSVYYSFTAEKSVTNREAATDDIHHSKWSIRTAIVMLIISTLGIVFMAEALVGAVEHVAVQFGLSQIFIGIILVPLIGNVAEHLVAVQVAYKNKMELSMAISLGSSLQIALFVAPVLVFISLLSPTPMLLVFNGFELIALAVSSFIAAFIAQDGESNWLEGAMLLGIYAIFAIAFFVMPAAEAIAATAH
jgi:Ca2+:H+ antiporter